MIRTKPRIDENAPPLTQVLAEVEAERRYQDSKWGVQDHPQMKWATILGEEFGEICKAIMQEDTESYRAELIQVAAVCVAAAQSFDRINIQTEE